MAVGPRLTVCPDCGYQWAPPAHVVAPPPIPHGAIAAAQPKPNSAAPFLWLALIVGGICGVSAIVGAIQYGPKSVGTKAQAVAQVELPEPHQASQPIKDYRTASAEMLSVDLVRDRNARGQMCYWAVFRWTNDGSLPLSKVRFTLTLTGDGETIQYVDSYILHYSERAAQDVRPGQVLQGKPMGDDSFWLGLESQFQQYRSIEVSANILDVEGRRD